MRLFDHARHLSESVANWFPEGEVMEHGATQHEDVTVLLVSNKAFGINFVA